MAEQTQEEIKRPWYFTLAANQGGPCCVEVWATDGNRARDRMCENYGLKWAFQYESLDEIHPLDREIKEMLG